MISLFAGEDTFESYVAAGIHAQKLSKDLNLPIKVLNGDDLESPEEFSQQVESVDMFSSESIIIAKRLLRNKEIASFLQDRFDQFHKYHIVIWQDGTVDKRLSLIKSVQKKGMLQSFEQSKEWQLTSWLNEQAKKRSIQLSKEQSLKMIQLVGTDKWILVNELKKIGLYLEAKDKEKVNDQELEFILGTNVRGDIWKFLDGFAFKQTQIAINEFEKLSQYEDVSQYIISMLERELSLLVKVKLVEKNQGDYKTLGLHPFVLQNTLKKSASHSIEKLQSSLYALFELDLSIKTGKVNPQTGIIMYIIEHTK